MILWTQWYYNLTPSLSSSKWDVFSTFNCLIILPTSNVSLYRRRNTKFDVIRFSRRHSLSMINFVSWRSTGGKQVWLQWHGSSHTVQERVECSGNFGGAPFFLPSIYCLAHTLALLSALSFMHLWAKLGQELSVNKHSRSGSFPGCFSLCFSFQSKKILRPQFTKD